jgi:hypothetical protein
LESKENGAAKAAPFLFSFGPKAESYRDTKQLPPAAL